MAKMAGVIEGFRWAVLGKAAPDWGMVGVSLGVVAVLLVGGVMFSGGWSVHLFAGGLNG